MRRTVAVVAACVAAIGTWVGSSQAAPTRTTLTNPADGKCSTYEACVRATLFLNRVSSPSELRSGRIMVVTPDLAHASALIVDYRQGDSLLSLIRHNGYHAPRYAEPTPRVAHYAPRKHHKMQVAHRKAGPHMAALARTATPAPVVNPSPATTTTSTSSLISPANAAQAAQTGQPASHEAAMAARVTNLEKEAATLRTDLTQERSGNAAAKQKIADLEQKVNVLSARKPLTLGDLRGALPQWLKIASLALLALLLAALVALGAGLWHLRRRLTRLTVVPETSGAILDHPVPDRLEELEGSLLPFKIEMPASYRGPSPTFDAVIHHVEPILRTMPGGRTRLDAVLFGYGPWAARPGDPGFTDDMVELGYVDADGRLHIKPHGLTKQLGRGLNSEIGPRGARIQEWAKREGYANIRTTENFSVTPITPTEMRAAA